MVFLIRRKIFIFILIFSWIFPSLPPIWQNPRIPPKIQEAQANSTGDVYTTSNSADGSLTGWTNPTYAYTDDGTNFATRAGTTKNQWYGTLYGFDLSGIPDGAIINSVTITAEWKNSAADTSGPVLYLGAQSGGSEVGTGTSDTSGQTAFELVTKTPTGLTAANLKATGASGFWAILRFRRTDNTVHTASVDYVKVVVDYTPIVAPTVSTQAAGSVEATTATGNGTIDATGGENASAWGVCYKTSSPCTTADSTAAGSGSGGTGAFTASMTSLSSGTTYYIKAYATNSAGTSYGSEVQILTKPAAPTSVAATDGTYTDKVTITWTKSTGATDYHVWRDSTDLGAAGDVATFDDTGADAPTITAGTASATDGSATDKVTLSISGASANNGTTHTYKVVASNATGNSADSSTDTGYRGVGSLTYQWSRSSGTGDSGYSTLSGATTAPHDDTTAPAPTITAGTADASDGTFAAHVALSVSGQSANIGAVRYYYATVSATGASSQDTNHNDGYIGVGSLTYQWQRSAADSDASYSNIDGATTASYNDTGAPADGSGRYYKVVENATGATQQTSTSDRGYRSAVSLTFVVSTNVFPSLTPGSPVFATSTLSVDTDNSTGWNVTVARDDPETTMDLDSDATTNITDQTAWSPGAATTTAGNAARVSSLDSSGDVLAMRVMTASGTPSFISTAWWGTTDAYTDSATTLWAGFNSTAKKIGDSSASSGGSAKLNTVLYYLDVPSTQKTGAYSGGITYTATMNP